MLRQARFFIVFLFFSSPFATRHVLSQSSSLHLDQAESWSLIETSNDPTARHENGFIAYGDKLYLLGGRGVKRVQIFDPSTNSWTNGAFSPFQIHHFQAVIFNDLIYMVGAYTGACCDAEFGVSNVWAYNPQTDQWIEKHEIPANRRRGSTGAVVYNNKIYIAGGLDGGHGSTATSFNWFDEYDPVTGEWNTLPNAPRKRDHFHAVLYNGKMYLTGGRDTSDPSVTQKTIKEIDVYNFITESWSTLDASSDIPTPRGGASSVFYQGEILVIGGETHYQTLALNITEAFNPATESWRTLDDLVTGRHGTQASVLNGAVYIAAGSAQKGGEPELDTIERYENTDVVLTSATQPLNRGWNLVGLPLSPTSSDYSILYNDVELEAGVKPMTWDGNSSYKSTSTLSVGAAYWLKIKDDASPNQNQKITGTAVEFLQIPLTAGWNMISGPSCDNIILHGSSTNPTGAIPYGALYSFENGYEPAFTSAVRRGEINQGIGYWAYASKAATLTLDCSGNKMYPPAEDASSTLEKAENDFGVITAGDATGASRQLYFGADMDNEELEAFNLPPRLYGDYFDVRFSDNRRLVTENDGYITLQAGRYPLTLIYSKAPEGHEGVLSVVEMSDSRDLRGHELQVGESVTIYDAQTRLVRMQFTDKAASDIPEGFALRGNYPNPFNPTTRLIFDLAQTADITLEVYDATGRQVYGQFLSSVPAEQNLSIVLDAAAWPAGAYFYKVTAQTSTRVLSRSGQMVLLK